ncbi:MAG: phage holin family protein [Christensenellales bacterium]
MMNAFAQCFTTPAITAIVYMIIEVYKSVIQENEKYRRIIPLIALFSGMVLGILAFLVSPEIMPSGNILGAIFIGGCNGLAATGANQVYKQLKKQ